MNKGFICFLSFIIIFLSGCSNNEIKYAPPSNYYASIEICLLENIESKYNLDVYYNNNKYYFIVNKDNSRKWYIIYDGVNFKISNEKFDNDVMISNLLIFNQLFNELDLLNFEEIIYENKIVHNNGKYKYILELEENCNNPKVILVYNNNELIKEIKYINFIIDNCNNDYFQINEDIIVH